MVRWRTIRPSRTKTQKRCPFHYRQLECKSRNSRDIWNNRPIWPWIKNEVGQRLACQENILCQQHKRRLYIWTSPDDQCLNQIDNILHSQRWRSFTQSAKTREGADCGSDHELLTAKFRLKWKKVGKTTGEGSGTPLQHSCLENPMDGGAW